MNKIIDHHSMLDSYFKQMIYETVNNLDDRDLKNEMFNSLQRIEQEYLYLVSDYTIELLDIKQD